MPNEVKIDNDQHIAVINKDVKPKNVGGAPIQYEPAVVTDKFNDYIDTVELPIIEEFCAQQRMSKDTFYRILNKYPRLSDVKRIADAKAEAYIQKNALAGKGNPVFSIFMLKQDRFGWKDKSEVEHNINVVNYADRLSSAEERKRLQTGNIIDITPVQDEE